MEKFKKKSGRPVSGILSSPIIYLGHPSLDNSCNLPAGIERATLPIAIGTGILGLATHKVYPIKLSPAQCVGSYPTFSPLPRTCGAVIFCGTCCFR